VRVRGEEGTAAASGKSYPSPQLMPGDNVQVRPDQTRAARGTWPANYPFMLGDTLTSSNRVFRFELDRDTGDLRTIDTRTGRPVQTISLAPRVTFLLLDGDTGVTQLYTGGTVRDTGGTREVSGDARLAWTTELNIGHGSRLTVNDESGGLQRMLVVSGPSGGGDVVMRVAAFDGLRQVSP
jgi:hypothetical protein